MTRDVPFRALIAGAGPAAIEAVLTLREFAPAIEVGLLAPEPNFVYRPLSVMEPFARPGVRRSRPGPWESGMASGRRC